jgi:transcriptional regulator with XRE-family HTH domain
VKILSVGERIAELRKNENISQVQLAQLVGVSRQAVSKWENGLSLPDSLKMILLAEVLKTDVEYLTTGRKNDAIRPPVVIKTVETLEKTVEVPVVKVIEKPVEVEKRVEIPVIQYVEKPVIKKVVRVVTRRNPLEYLITGTICFALGLLVGILL